MSLPKLNTKETAALKQRAHHLHAVVMIGQNGLTDAVIRETDANLAAHELIKVQVAGGDRRERIAVAEALCQAVGALLVQHIGKQLVLWRPKPEEA
ncbi:MAG: ribosome assembly RNA-binding protein YhbY [Eikenella sp.]|nr:ribosome assembly RNA-binding protein YhbY [Eikenella sp.]